MNEKTAGHRSYDTPDKDGYYRGVMEEWDNPRFGFVTVHYDAFRVPLFIVKCNNKVVLKAGNPEEVKSFLRKTYQINWKAANEYARHMAPFPKGYKGGATKKGYDETDLNRDQQMDDFLDKTHDLESIAYEAFIADPEMQALAQDDGVTINALWERYKKEYTNEYWQNQDSSGL